MQCILTSRFLLFLFLYAILSSGSKLHKSFLSERGLLFLMCVIFLAKMQSFKRHTFAQISTTKFVFLIQWFRTEIFENACWFKVHNTGVSAWSLSTDLLWAAPALDRNRSSAVKKLNQLLPKSCRWHGTIYDPESITLVLKKLLLRLGDQTHVKSTLSQYSSPPEVKL